MKRSGSHSNIPMPNRQRSSSSSRDSLNPRPSYTRQRSFDLPSQKRSTGSTGQNFRTPQLSTRRYGSTSSQKTQSSSHHNKPVINDKKVASENYMKIRSWLYEIGEGQIAESLKPPSIKTFVTVMDLLFKQIDAQIEITTANYKEEIVKWMKFVGYLNNIPVSLLKTPNTMHTWPQIMNIFGWLLDYVYVLQMRLPCLVPESIEEAGEMNNPISECTLDILQKRYDLFNFGYDESSIVSQYKSQLYEIFDVDLKVSQQMETDIETLNDKMEQSNAKLHEKNTILELLENDVKRLKRELDRFDGDVTLSDLDLQLEVKQSENANAESLLKRQMDLVEKLKQQLANQKAPVDFRKKIADEMDRLKNTEKNIQESIDVREDIQVQLDKKIKESKKIIEDKVYSINNLIRALSVWNPNMQSLKLRETGFFCEVFQNEIDNFDRVITERKRVVAGEMSANDKHCSELKEKLISKQTEWKTINANVKRVNQEIESVQKLIETVVSKSGEVVQNGQTSLEDMAKELKNIQDKTHNPETLESQLKKLQTLYQKKIDDQTVLEHEMIAESIRVRNECTIKVGEANDKQKERRRKLLQQQRELEALQVRMLETLHTLDDIRADQD